MSAPIFTASPGLPVWVPDAARLYLAHTEDGRPIRALARDIGCHASTVLRQVRKIENRRDDPLVDAALRQLSAYHIKNRVLEVKADQSEPPEPSVDGPSDPPDDVTLRREAFRVLRRLCESGAVLAVAQDMDRAVVVRDSGNGMAPARTAVVEVPVAEALALKAWIHCDAPGRISRYRITAAGRAALNEIVAEQENRRQGFNEAQAAFDPAEARKAVEEGQVPEPERRIRHVQAESPLAILSRRRDKDGTLFLQEDLVAAGERLREDFELAQITAQTAEDWQDAMGGTAQVVEIAALRGAEAARGRLTAALRDLGPGLGDIALRCCCYLEGLETTERRMGWSARSGKVVLRIALQRLKRHYAEQAQKGGDLIG